MSDVREQLVKLLYTGDGGDGGFYELADTILERFDVTPKAAVAAADLGRMASKAAGGHTGDVERVGFKMLDQLDAAGLMIVRVDDHD